MTADDRRTRVLILGAGGRDFHNFNMLYRDDPAVEVVAFTATQIPGIEGRTYPPSLAGPYYPNGIRIEEAAHLEQLCRSASIDQVVFSYSDITHEEVMHVASRALSAGASFVIPGPEATMLRAPIPVIAVTAVRTGCGKSPISRWLSRRLRDRGLKVGVLRHPMPYGELERQAVQRFASRDDLERHDCTNEEREEYEPYIDAGGVVYAGVDYSRILDRARGEADILIWDGGNNDFSFLRPDLNITVLDALRPGQATCYHPGETVLRMAQVAIVNKVDAASEEDVRRVLEEVADVNPAATVLRGASPVTVDEPERVKGRRVLVVEDGPTITHGGMSHGAGYVAAQANGASEIIDPRVSASPEIRAIYDQYPHIGRVLPAVGYYGAQLEDLRQTIENSAAETIVIATPFDLGKRLRLSRPCVRVRYAYADTDEPGLGAVIDDFLETFGL